MPDEEAGRTRVVQVDVGEQEMAKVAEQEPTQAESRLECRQAGARAAIDQRRLVARQQIGGNDPRPPEVLQVEKLRAAS